MLLLDFSNKSYAGLMIVCNHLSQVWAACTNSPHQ
jgi:hypothetical protein